MTAEQNIIKELENCLSQKPSAEELKKVIERTDLLQYLNVDVFKNADGPLFRIRSCTTFKDWECNHVSGYSYSPKPGVGRCNLDKQPVLYLGLDSKTAIKEVFQEIPEVELVGNNVCISLWKPLKDLKCKFFLQSPERITDPLIKPVNQSLYEDYLEKLSGNGLNENEINNHLELIHWIGEKFTSADHLFSSVLSDMVFKNDESVDGILYPSVAGALYGSNIALRKESADSSVEITNLYLVKIEEYTQEKSQYMLTNRGDISEDGDISLYTFVAEGEKAIFITESSLREKFIEKENAIIFNQEIGK